MNRKQKIIKKTAKRAKARMNKHTAPTIKKYVSKAERAEQQAKLAAEAGNQADVESTNIESTEAVQIADATDIPVAAN